MEPRIRQDLGRLLHPGRGSEHRSPITAPVPQAFRLPPAFRQRLPDSLPEVFRPVFRTHQAPCLLGRRAHLFRIVPANPCGGGAPCARLRELRREQQLLVNIHAAPGALPASGAGFARVGRRARAAEAGPGGWGARASRISARSSTAASQSVSLASTIWKGGGRREKAVCVSVAGIRCRMQGIQPHRLPPPPRLVQPAVALRGVKKCEQAPVPELQQHRPYLGGWIPDIRQSQRACESRPTEGAAAPQSW